MKLILLGGMHGVGKTTLLNSIRQKFEEICFFDPGKYFWEYHFEQKKLSITQVERLVVEEIRKLRKQKTVVCNWHYAVWSPDGYIMQLTPQNFIELIIGLRPEKVYLILIQASVESVFQRRKKDILSKKRKLNRQCVEEEIKQTQIFLKIHEYLSRLLVQTETVVIQNEDFGKAQKLLVECFKKICV